MSMFFRPPMGNVVGGQPVGDASKDQKGLVQLFSDIDSDSETLAATPLAVKNAVIASKDYTDEKINDIVHKGNTAPPSNTDALWLDTSI